MNNQTDGVDQSLISLIDNPVNIVFAVSIYCIGFVCTIGNVLAICVLFRTRRLLHPPIRHQTSLILFNLTIAGLIIGIVWCPVCATQLLTAKFRNDLYFEQTRRFLGIELPGAFIFLIVSISYDRFLIFKNRTSQEKHLTKRNSIVLVALSWLIPLPVPLVRFINRTVFTYIVAFIILFGFAVVAVTYLYMLQIVSESEKRVMRPQQLDATTSPAMLCKPAGEEGATKLPLRRLNKTIRLTRTASILILTYLVCHVPFAVYLLVRLFNPTLISAYISQICILLGELLTQVNAALNPAIYFMTSNAYVKEIKKMFSFKSRKDFDTISSIVEMRRRNIIQISPAPYNGVPKMISVQPKPAGP